MKLNVELNTEIPWQTKYRFTEVPAEICERAYDRFYWEVLGMMDMCRYLKMTVPAMGEIHEDFLWIELENHWVEVDKEAKELSIIVLNQPECKDDRLDPEHEEWEAPNPMQWVEVAGIFKNIKEGVPA